MGKKKVEPAAPEKSERRRAWDSYLDRVLHTVKGWLHDRKIELEDKEPEELRATLSGLLVPVETRDGMQLMSPEALPGGSEEKAHPGDCPFSDDVLREAHARKRVLLDEAIARSAGDRRFIAEKLDLFGRGYAVDYVERVVDFSESKGSFFDYRLRLSDGSSVALGPPEDAINQGKVRSALAQVGHVLMKKGEGEWTQIAQMILDAEVSCRLRWGKGDETLERAIMHPEPAPAEEGAAA